MTTDKQTDRQDKNNMPKSFDPGHKDCNLYHDMPSFTDRVSKLNLTFV